MGLNTLQKWSWKPRVSYETKFRLHSTPVLIILIATSLLTGCASAFDRVGNAARALGGEPLAVDVSADLVAAAPAICTELEDPLQQLAIGVLADNDALGGQGQALEPFDAYVQGWDVVC